jgi:hypothetical protein
LPVYSNATALGGFSKTYCHPLARSAIRLHTICVHRFDLVTFHALAHTHDTVVMDRRFGTHSWKILGDWERSGQRGREREIHIHVCVNIQIRMRKQTYTHARAHEYTYICIYTHSHVCRDKEREEREEII